MTASNSSAVSMHSATTSPTRQARMDLRRQASRNTAWQRRSRLFDAAVLEVDAEDATGSADEPAGALVGKGHGPTVGDPGQGRPGVALFLLPGDAARAGGDGPPFAAIAFLIILVLVFAVVAGVRQ